jgi:hypothetical protein
MNEWMLVYLCWNVLFALHGVLKSFCFSFGYKLIRTTQWNDLYSAGCHVGKTRYCTPWRWPVLFADCVFIYVTCGSYKTHWTKKKLRKIWRRTSDWTENVVSCIWEQVLLVVKNMLLYDALFRGHPFRILCDTEGLPIQVLIFYQ